MDKLKGTHFLAELTGTVYLHQYEAVMDLDTDCARSAIMKTAETTLPGTHPSPSECLAGLEPAKVLPSQEDQES